jgi:hypothetical protein
LTARHRCWADSMSLNAIATPAARDPGPQPALASPGPRRRRRGRLAGAARVAPDLAAPAGVTVAAGLGWLLRFRNSPDIIAWRRSAVGERRTARLLAPLERRGWAVLHDLAIPNSQANIDHLVIGPGGVLAIDSKQYRGRLRVDHDGMVWHGRHLLVSALRTTLWRPTRPTRSSASPTSRSPPSSPSTAPNLLGRTAGRRGHRRRGPAATRPAPGAAAYPWAGTGGLAGRPRPATVPIRRLTGRTSRRCKRYCWRGLISGAQ